MSFYLNTIYHWERYYPKWLISWYSYRDYISPNLSNLSPSGSSRMRCATEWMADLGSQVSVDKILGGIASSKLIKRTSDIWYVYVKYEQLLYIYICLSDRNQICCIDLFVLSGDSERYKHIWYFSKSCVHVFIRSMLVVNHWHTSCSWDANVAAHLVKNIAYLTCRVWPSYNGNYYVV